MQDKSTARNDKPPQRRIELARIAVVPRRLHEDIEALSLLGKSLRLGQLQAIGVMEIAEQPGYYQLIWGERRVRAAYHVRLTHLEAVVLPPMEAEAAILISWRENSERADLTDMERLGVLEQLRAVQGGRWPAVEAALGISEGDRKRLLKLKRLDPEAFKAAGRLGIRAYALEPLLVLIRDRQVHGRPTIPEMMQLRILRELSHLPTVDYCRHLVQRYFPEPSAVNRPEEERQLAAFASRLSSLTDAIYDLRQASQSADALERASLCGSIGRVVGQLTGLLTELQPQPDARVA